MRKLKAFLLLLFAACLSLTLFACGGGKKDDSGNGDEPGPGTDQPGPGTDQPGPGTDDPGTGGSDTDDLVIEDVRVRGTGIIELTDADDEAKLKAELAKVTVVVTYTTGDSAAITGSEADCTVTHNVVFGTVDTAYSAILTPKEHNADGLTIELQVHVDHAWVADSDNANRSVCSVDGATRTLYDEDIAIHYGTFHEGTANKSSSAIRAAALTAEEAAALGLSAAEVSNGEVFNNAAGINKKNGEAVTSSGNIGPLGADEAYGAGNGIDAPEIPSLTAGRLEPGMSISISGYAKTDITAGDYDPWGHANEYYNAPSFGIADRYNTDSTWAHGGYAGGVSVIVRSEGWVLYNGIGDPRLLAGLPAFIEGGNAPKNGAGTGSNYGSTADSNTRLNGFDAENPPEPTSDDWHDWWVYSFGTTTNSGDQYGSYTAITVTWTYRTYEVGDTEVGIIEIVRKVGSNTLTSRIKVPTATNGFYDTIIHGDYSSLIITSSSIIETETTTAMTVNGLKANATAKYLAGQTINAGNTIDVTIETAQKPGQPRSFSISNEMLYYYTGETQTVAQATTDIADETKWEVVGKKALTTAMKIFKVEAKRSGETFRGLVLTNGEPAITVVENNAKAAYGFDYSEDLRNNKKTAEYTLALAGNNARFTLASGIVQQIPTGQESVFGLDASTAGDYRYIVAKIEGIEAFGTVNAQIDGTNTNVKVAATKEGNDVLIAFALKEAALGEAIAVSGIQTNPIEFVFGEDIYGFEVVSESNVGVYTDWDLDVGGEVTLTYDTADITEFNVFYGGQTYNRTVRYLNGSSGISQGDVDISDTPTGVVITAFKQENGTTEITIKFPAFAFGSTEMPYVEARMAEGTTTKAVARDYINYNFEFSEDGEFVADGGFYTYVEGGKLYIVKAIKAVDGVVSTADTALAGVLKVTANDGDLETAKQLDLSFSGDHGVATFNNTTLAGKVRKVTVDEETQEINIYAINQTLFTATEGDAGMLITVEVDLEGAFGFAGAYGIEVNPGAESTTYWWYENGKLTVEEIGEVELEIIEEGSCLAPGIVAGKVTNADGSVKYYAAYQEIGGDHSFDAQGVCTKCGATRSEVISEGYTPQGGNHVDDVFAWYGTAATSAIAQGEIVEARGTFKDDESKFGKNGIGILVWEDSNKALFQVAGIGDVLYSGTASNIWGTRVEPYDETAFPNGSDRITSSNITEAHPYNTLNGVLDRDGVAVSTANMSSLLTGGGFRYIVEYKEGLIVATLNFYVEGQTFNNEPQFTMTATFTTKPGSTYEVWFMGGDGNDCYLDGNKIELVKSLASNSAISTVEAATVGGHTASSNVAFAATGSTITASGMAAKENAAYYLAFKVKFSKALSATTRATVMNGDAALAGATATFNQAYDELEVYIPLSAGNVPETLLIDLINYEASTLQDDITLDLTKVICSEVTATVTGADALTIAEGEFTIAYAGGVQETDTIVIGETSKAISEIGTQKDAATAFGDTGYSAYISTALNGGNVTITFVKAAVDLTKPITGADILLKRGTQSLAFNTIAPAITIPTETQEIEESGWYVIADGTTLTLLSSANKAPSTLPFNVNAGHTTETAHLGIYELAFKIDDGAVVFENATNYLAKATTAAYTEYNGKFIVALTIDLTKFEIAADTAYGFAIETEGATKFYTVTATERAISEQTMEKTSLLDIATEDPCTNDTVKGYGNGAVGEASFYYGLTVRPAGHAFPAEGGECTACQEVTGWVKENIVVGKDNGQWSTAAADGYDPADTEKYGALVKGQKAVFKGTIKTATASIGTSYLNMHGLMFKIGGLTMRCDGYCDAITNSVGTYAANKWDINMQQSVKYDGTAVSGGSIPWGNAVLCRGNAEATIIYDWTNDSAITITFITEGAEHTFEIVALIMPSGSSSFEKDIYEIGLLPFNGYFEGMLTVTGDKDKVPAAQCNQWIRDPSAEIPDPEYTDDSLINADGGFTMGTEGTAGTDSGWVGYTNTPNWIGKLEKGKKIVITGTQKAMATEPFWSSLTFFVWSGTNASDRSGDTGICMNHANPSGSGNEGGQNVEAWTIGGPSHKLTGGTDFATLIKEVGADCNVTITFDWTQYNKQFSVTMKLEKSDASKAVETTYTFTEDEGGTLLGAYNVGIGVDHSYGVLKTITRSEQAPTQDLPGAEAVTHRHAYENGLCTTCGGVQPATGVGGTAVEGKSWDKSQAFNAKIWTMTLKKGGKVVAYGTQEGDVASNWFSLLAYVGLGDSTKSITIRSDNFAFYEDHKWTNDPAHTLPDGNKQNGIKSPNGADSALDWTAFAGIAKHCDWRVEFDWTGEVVVVTMTFTGTADNQYKGSTVFFKYTLEAASFEGKETATIGLGAETAAGTVVCYVATDND